MVPWHHVGNGTRADLASPTRRPHTAGSARSSQFQGADFLSRLQADMRRRQQSLVRCRRRALPLPATEWH
jgi:hypothetical protein